MKIKYQGLNPDPDRSIDLVSTMQSAGIITDPDNQILGIYGDRIELDGISPSEALSNILVGFPDYRIFTGPGDVDAFKPEPGLKDIDKIGTVPDPNYKEPEPPINEIQLFPESELDTFSESTAGNVDRIQNNFNEGIMSKQKTFNDPALDPNGVALDSKKPAVEQEQAEDKNNFTPAAGSFSSFEGVTTFSDAEIEKGNDIEVDVTPEGEVTIQTAGSDPTNDANGVEVGNDINAEVEEDGQITVFSEEDIENVSTPEELEEAADKLEKEMDTFNEKKFRLFAAKDRLRRLNKKAKNRKSFAEDLSESEKSDVIEDIIAILKDSPEIKEAVAEEVEGLVTPAEVEEPANTEEPAQETFAEGEETPTNPESTEETTEETTEEGGEPKDEETGLAEGEVTKIGEIFCKTFSDNSVHAYRRQFLSEMANKQPNRKFK